VLPTHSDRLFKRIAQLGIATLSFGVIAGMFSWIYILRSPDEAHGFVYRLNLHGTFVYVTKIQFLANKYAPLISAIGVVVMVVGRLLGGKNIFGKWKD
jgi:hypothetical protein